MTLLLGPLLIVFAALCLITSAGVSIFSVVGSEQARAEFPAEGGQTKPFTIDKANTILDIAVSQNLPVDTWSDVTVSLVDASGEPLIGVGDGLWHEDGYDEGEYWNQADSSYSGRVVVHEPGTYRLDVEVSDNIEPIKREDAPITVTAKIGGMSYIPHFAAGVIALLLGVILTFVHASSLERAVIQRGL